MRKTSKYETPKSKFTYDLLDALIPTDRPASDGKNFNLLYDEELASRRRQEITPARLRRASEFLKACAASLTAGQP
jgi:hypothetical protein